VKQRLLLSWIAACLLLPGSGAGALHAQTIAEPPAAQRVDAATAAPAVERLSPAERNLLAYWRSHPREPREYVLDKFDQGRKWVFLGEYHRVRHDVELVLELIPTLHRSSRVRHLALEFLCRERTEEANRLVTRPDYDRRRTIDFFRDQFPSWGYEEYLQIFEATWKTNRELAGSKGPFRLIGLHPCVDWERIHYGRDEAERARELDKQNRYDELMAEALEAQLLSRGVPALVYTGIAHSTAKFREYRAGTDQPLPRMGNLVYRPPYQEDMFFIALHAPFWDAASSRDVYPFDGVLDRLMLIYGRNLGFDVVGTPFETLRHARPAPRSQTAYSFGELFDGYIIHRTPIKEYQGITCIEDWIVSEAQYEHFWKHLANKEASKRFAEASFADYRRDHCTASADYGAGFKRRFRDLPDP
jgi:hypothetical protein